MTGPNAGRTDTIRFHDVSKFYGEVLGCNGVDLELGRGITSLVGPNGSGKSTLMNLATGLLRPTRGRIDVLGIRPGEPEELFRRVGYCTQFDAFPAGATGMSFVEGFLALHGDGARATRERAWRAIERLGLADAALRPIASYSKGMRQRIKLAQAIAHEPEVLLLDEPMNGLDPMARAEAIDVFRKLAVSGRTIVISSHILHEVDMVADRVVLLKAGYVVADGAIGEVREEVRTRPLQVLVRCDRPSLLASRLFESDHVVDARIQDDGRGIVIRTQDADRFHRLVRSIVREQGLCIEAITPADSDLHAVYRYLIEEDDGS